MVNHPTKMRETQARSLGWEDLLEKEMETHSSTLAWKIPSMEEHGRLQSMGSQNWTRLSNFTFTFDQNNYIPMEDRDKSHQCLSFSCPVPSSSEAKAISDRKNIWNLRINGILVYFTFCLLYNAPSNPLFGASLEVQMVKNLPAMHLPGRCRFDPCVGKILWRRNGNPIQYSCLENSRDRRAWWATVHGVTHSQTQLRD